MFQYKHQNSWCPFSEEESQQCYQAMQTDQPVLTIIRMGSRMPDGSTFGAGTFQVSFNEYIFRQVDTGCAQHCLHLSLTLPLSAVLP